MKKFWYKLAMIAMVAALSIGFSVTAFAYDEAEIIDIAEQYLDYWNEYDFQTDINGGSLDAEGLAMYTQWQEIKNSIGEFQEIKGNTITEEDGLLKVNISAAYSNSELTFTVNYVIEMIDAYGAFNSISGFDVVPGSAVSNSPDMGKAAMNTIMGMGIVFTVLVAMIWIFSLIKYIPGIVEKFSGSSKEQVSIEVSRPVENTVSTVIEKEENLIDNSELVAVITGAIMAATANQQTADGFVVRSIRRRR